MKLFNTASGKTEPILDKTIGIYVCGITPYDTTHLGHAFTFISYDVLVRYLRYLGKAVTYVQNVTDIDDDVLRKSKELGVTWRELGDRETKKFVSDMNALNWQKPDHYVKATDSIPQMIEIIKKLIKRGYAYKSGDSVYFSIKTDLQFGKRLNKFKNVQEMLKVANERGNFANDPNKKDPLDFVLWQGFKEGEPFWQSSWGKGRPGWHIECSAMSSRYLGIPFTIHGGGTDLKFPHHEAELSQAKAFGDKFVKVWMHAATVYMDGEKMSKSLGNMVFASDLLKKYSPNAIRWYLISHQYRNDWEWKQTEMDEAAKEFLQFERKLKTNKKGSIFELKKEFAVAMNNDLDIPKALKLISKMAEVENAETKELARRVLGFIIK